MRNVTLSVVKNSARIVKIDDSEYFSGDGYKDMIDNSSLGLINDSQGGSVEKYLNGFKNTGKRSYFEVGSAVHALLLENCYALSDFDKIPSSRRILDVVDYMFSNCSFDVYNPLSVKDALKTSAIDIGYNGGHITDTTIQSLYDKSIDYIKNRQKDVDKGYDSYMFYLPKNSKDTVLSCCNAILNDKRINGLLHPVNDDLSEYDILNEYAILVNVKITIGDKEIVLPLKGKLDSLMIDRNTNSYVINDLKTTFHSAKDFNESFNRYHYYRQAAFYRFLCSCVFTDKKFSGFNFLCVSTYDYSTCIRNVRNKEMEYGKEEFIRLLILVAEVKMAIRDGNDINIFDKNSIRALACSFNDKIELITLICVLKQAFNRKGEDLTTRKLLEKVRKEKYESTSESLIQSISILVECMYSPKDVYNMYNCKSGKEISARINEIMDKELPFASSEWDCKDDLPF